MRINQKSEVDGQYRVEFWHAGSGAARVYHVTYGKQERVFNDAILALEEYESCVRHQWTCAGLLDECDPAGE